jgi:hypothetical protein
VVSLVVIYNLIQIEQSIVGIFNRRNLLDYQYKTGSFNFTVSAAKRNVENVLIIQDSKIAHSYLQNWLARKSANQGRVFRK